MRAQDRTIIKIISDNVSYKFLLDYIFIFGYINIQILECQHNRRYLWPFKFK